MIFGSISPCSIQTQPVQRMFRTVQKPLTVLLGAIVLTGGSIGFLANSAQAQSMMQEQGSLQPVQHEHTFSGEAGQTVMITLSSDEFDPYLVLLDPSGKEIAVNDDYARSLNSAIVFTLPESGQYKVVARSFSGQGGNYAVNVQPASPFDRAYARGMQLLAEGKIAEAETALSEAIQIAPSVPAPYLDRAELFLALGNLPSAVSDYQQAATLYEQAGNREAAEQIRQHLAVVQEQ